MACAPCSYTLYNTKTWGPTLKRLPSADLNYNNFNKKPWTMIKTFIGGIVKKKNKTFWSSKVDAVFLCWQFDLIHIIWKRSNWLICYSSDRSSISLPTFMLMLSVLWNISCNINITLNAIGFYSKYWAQTAAMQQHRTTVACTCCISTDCYNKSTLVWRVLDNQYLALMNTVIGYVPTWKV